MKRAVIIIGVAKTGGLPTLQSTAGAINGVYEWALQSQHIPNDLVFRITDEQGKVGSQSIKDAVSAVVARNDVTQLIIYFAGHGVSKNYNEYWLLTDAPVDLQAAVDVRGSAGLAAYCGIPHVVFLSDACRTAAAGIVAQAVTGSVIFPNLGPGGLAGAVDLFYASTMGHPAYEVGLPGDSADTFVSVYTEVLVDVLRNGFGPDAAPPDDHEAGFVWPEPLKIFLRDAVPRKLQALGVPLTTWQTPDAQVCADGSWISQLGLPLSGLAGEPPAGLAAGNAAAAMNLGEPPGEEPRAASPISLTTISEAVLSSALQLGTGKPAAEFAPSSSVEWPGSGAPPKLTSTSDPSSKDELAERTEDRAVAALQEGIVQGMAWAPLPSTFPDSETGCGFLAQGAVVVNASCALPGRVTVIGDGRSVIADGLTKPGTSVALSFDNGSCCVLPAVQGYAARLRFQGDELVDVGYEPTPGNDLRAQYDKQEAQLRRLRAVVSSATRLGVFRLEQTSADELARQMQLLRTVDLSLALYATYAYWDIGRRDRLEEMRSYLLADPGVAWFDLAMLLRARTRVHADLPFVPALSQGWPLATALKAGDPQLLSRLQQHLLPSPWTLFAQPAWPVLEAAVQQEATS